MATARRTLDLPGKEILAEVRRETDTVLLAFSCGKDSLAAWIFLKDYGFKVVAYHMAIFPGLRFVEGSLRYYEEFFGQHIYRTLHPSLYAWIDTFVGQPPGRRQVINQLELPFFKYPDVEQAVKRTAGLASDSWVAVATKRSDSAFRRIRMKDINRAKRQFFPLVDWSKEDILTALKYAKVKVPVDYQMFARSYDGIDYRFLSAIRRDFPDDYDRMREWFPTLDLEFARQKMAVKHGQSA